MRTYKNVGWGSSNRVDKKTGGLRMIKRIEKALKTSSDAVFGGGALF